MSEGNYDGDNPRHSVGVYRAVGSWRPLTGHVVAVAGRMPERGALFDLCQPSTTIGRSAANDIHLEDESVSEAHCKVINTGRSLLLRDLGSLNGTLVNGARIDEAALQDGDEVWAGAVMLRVLLGPWREANQRRLLDELAILDPLTGALVEPALLDHLGERIAWSRVGSGSGRALCPVSVLMFRVEAKNTVDVPAVSAIPRLLVSGLRAWLRDRNGSIGRHADGLVVVLAFADRADAREMARVIHMLFSETAASWLDVESPVLRLGAATACGHRLDAKALLGKARRRLERSSPEGPADLYAACEPQTTAASMRDQTSRPVRTRSSTDTVGTTRQLDDLGESSGTRFLSTLTMHYSSAGAHAGGVSCIALVSPEAEHVFSRAGCDDLDAELGLLAAFYDHLSQHPTELVYWNQGQGYGVSMLAHRYRELTGKPPLIEPRNDNSIELDFFIVSHYGHAYANLPRLERLLALNGFPDQAWLPTEEEAALHLRHAHDEIREATVDKARILDYLFRSTLDGSLRNDNEPNKRSPRRSMPELLGAAIRNSKS